MIRFLQVLALSLSLGALFAAPRPVHAACSAPLSGMSITLRNSSGTAVTCVNPSTQYEVEVVGPNEYAAYCIKNSNPSIISVPLVPYGFTVPSISGCEDSINGDLLYPRSFNITTNSTVQSLGIVGAVSPYCYDTSSVYSYKQEFGFAFPRCSSTTATCLTPPSGMVAWYTMDESSGTTVNDVVSTNEGTRTGAISVTGGRVGRALSFDGVDDYVGVPSSSSLNFGTGDFAMDVWIKTTDSSGVIASKRAYVGGKYVGYLFMVNSGRLLLQIGDSTSGHFNYWSSTSATVNDGQWHLVGFSVDRDNPLGGRLFRDGAVIHTFNPTGRTGDTSNSAPLEIGRTTGGGDYLNGIIDELEIFNRVLGLSEISAIHRNGAAGKCKPVQPQPLSASLFCSWVNGYGGEQYCTATASGGSGGYSFSWSYSGSGYLNPSGNTADVYITNCPSSSFLASVTVQDSAGATASASRTLSCSEPCGGTIACP